MGRVHRYEGTGIEVTYDASRCIHAARCVAGLPAVFDPERRPWVEPDRGDRDDVIRVIESCPTGALAYSCGDRSERPPAPARVTCSRDGPLYLRGNLTVANAEGEPIATAYRLALCRCGASSNKPYCDGSHTEAGFSDSE